MPPYRQSQLCLDTETDPRVDAATSRRLGIRSMLVVPVLDGEDLVGVLEVFATDPAEFVDSDQNLLEIFAREVTRIRRLAIELEQRPTAISVIRTRQHSRSIRRSLRRRRRTHRTRSGASFWAAWPFFCLLP